MTSTERPVAFVLAASDHGTMIVNRFDHAMSQYGSLIGVGHQILSNGAYDPQEVALLLELLERRRAHYGDGVVAVDCGANVGVHTLEWARRMTGWGRVIAFEAQERIFYALAGNLALNNCFNARAIYAAVGAQIGALRIPAPDYLKPGSFGSLELRASEANEFIGQTIDYSAEATVEVALTTIDALKLDRLDLLKIDVEGMEAEVLDGAAATIAARRPIIVAEHIKSGQAPLVDRLAPLGYRMFGTRMNVIAAHSSDPSSREMRAEL
jgi:FkbM family methyltransferase